MAWTATHAPTGVPRDDAAVLAALQADLDLLAAPPILNTCQRQGDVLVVPDRFKRLWWHRWTAHRLVDGQRLAVVAHGNGHVLVPSNISNGGAVLVWPGRTPNIALTMLVKAPAYCLLLQPTGPNPHLPLGIAPGMYVVCRQTEPQVVAYPTQAPGRELARQTWSVRVEAQRRLVD